jgi:hypothetical protein
MGIESIGVHSQTRGVRRCNSSYKANHKQTKGALSSPREKHGATTPYLSTSLAVSRRSFFSRLARTIIASASKRNTGTKGRYGEVCVQKQYSDKGKQASRQASFVFTRGFSNFPILRRTDHITIKPLAEQAFGLSVIIKVDHLGKEGKFHHFRRIKIAALVFPSHTTSKSIESFPPPLIDRIIPLRPPSLTTCARQDGFCSLMKSLRSWW